MSPRFAFITNYGLRVTFDPLVAAIPPPMPEFFVLQHWQAQPRGLRHFAYFDYRQGEGNYRTLPHPLVRISGIPQTLQIDERQTPFVPTAVLYYPDCELVKLEDFWELRNVG
ncbi:hypothetical protein [Thermosynechococcus sp. FA-CM-4201]